MCPGKFYKLKLYKIISEPVQTPAPLMSWQETQLNCSQVKEVIVVISEMKEGLWVKYQSQLHTSTIPALKHELLNSLLTFSSRKVLRWQMKQAVKFWFQNTCGKVKSDFKNRFELLILMWHFFWVTLYMIHLSGAKYDLALLVFMISKGFIFLY